MDYFEWTVIGAGPAGIAAVGQLIDANIPLKKIAWIDPTFTVGDFGTIWDEIISNTPVEFFIRFYRSFNAFEFDLNTKPFLIENLPPKDSCSLKYAAIPLTWITKHLQEKVTSYIDKATNLSQTSDGWSIKLQSQGSLLSKKIILAIGAEPITLPYQQLQTVPLKIAMNIERLNEVVDEEDTIAIFGSYESARTVSEHVLKTKSKRIIHFYRSERSFENYVSPIRLPDHVEYYPITPANLLTHISRCNKAIYAVGFKRRSIAIDNLPEDFTYDPKTGHVAPGIYGLGIAFPEIIPNIMGRSKYKASAILQIANHLKRVFPFWSEPNLE